MLTGFYTAASGVLMQQRSLNVIANNMSNGKTPGFKAERVTSTTFEQELLMRQEAGNGGAIGKGAPIRIVEDVPSRFDPALLEDSDSPFDLAINGEGFFNVQGPDTQQYLTRNGNFYRDDEGFLALRGAGRVLGMKGEIELKTSGFRVEEDGGLYDDKGKLVDQLLITAPNEGTLLAKFAGGLYQVDRNPAAAAQQPALDNAQQPGAAPAAAAEPGVYTVLYPNIRQNVLESSNIDMNREMALLMETQRSFQSCAKAMQMIDTVNQKTVSIAGQ